MLGDETEGASRGMRMGDGREVKCSRACIEELPLLEDVGAGPCKRTGRAARKKVLKSQTTLSKEHFNRSLIA